MTPEGFDWVLRSLARRVPFTPFAIEFVNGKRITIRHPEAVAFWNNLAMFRNQRGEFQFFGADAVCRTHDVAEEENDDIHLD